MANSKKSMSRNASPGPTAPSGAGLDRKSGLDAMPDNIGLNDWVYQPTLAPVPPVPANCSRLPEIPNQGEEGGGNGFAPTAVANDLLHNQGQTRRVSPRMMYEMARRHDEWPGDQSRNHGGFDNDAATLNSVLYRILGGTPLRPFTSRDLDYG
jgi:hypothetical protein